MSEHSEPASPSEAHASTAVAEPPSHQAEYVEETVSPKLPPSRSKVSREHDPEPELPNFQPLPEPDLSQRHPAPTPAQPVQSPFTPFMQTPVPGPHTPVQAESEPAFFSFQDAGTRNLFLAIFCSLAALIVLVAACVLSGPQALIPLATAILVLFLMATLWGFGLHRQKGGLFLAFALVTLTGAGVPLLLGIVTNLAGHGSLLKAAPQTAQQVAIPQQLILPGNAVIQQQPVVQQSLQPPLLSEAFGVYPPSGASAEQVRILTDSRVELDGRSYMMKAGQIFPIHSRSDDGVMIRAKDYLVTLPRDIVDVVAPAPVAVAGAVAPSGTPAAASPTPSPTPQVNKSDLVAKSQNEAVRRYPALAIQDSEENRIFVDTYQDLKVTKPELLEDPEWPLKLAQQLGTAYGWEDITNPATKKPILSHADTTLPSEDESSLFQSDTLYLNDPSAMPAASSSGEAAPPRAEAVLEEEIIKAVPQSGKAEVGEEDLDVAPPLEINPVR